MKAPSARRIDGAVGQERRQHDGRAPHYLAMHHDEPARQPLRLPLQQHFCEQQMRGRAADVDPDGGKLDILLAPDGARDLGALLFRHAEMFVKDVEIVHGGIRRERGRCARGRVLYQYREGARRRAGWRHSRLPWGVPLHLSPTGEFPSALRTLIDETESRRRVCKGAGLRPYWYASASRAFAHHQRRRCAKARETI